MAVLFRDTEFIVENRLLSGWRVTDRDLRQTFRPSYEMATRMGLTWHMIRRHNHADIIKQRQCEDALMWAFAVAVTNPGTSYEIEFLQGTPADLSHSIIAQAAGQ